MPKKPKVVLRMPAHLFTAACNRYMERTGDYSPALTYTDEDLYAVCADHYGVRPLRVSDIYGKFDSHEGWRLTFRFRTASEALLFKLRYSDDTL